MEEDTEKAASKTHIFGPPILFII